MHDHPLHRPVTTRCECCRLEQEFVFKAKSDHVVCRGCARHVGSNQRQKELRQKDHASLYWSELEICREDRAADAQRSEAAQQELRNEIVMRDRTIAEREVVIADLRDAIRRSELNPAVEEWLADEKVREACSKRDSAYRARDYALAALWRAARIHDCDPHRDDDCICGRKADQCRELGAISDELVAMREWEERQIQRLRDGLEHGLPREHPEVQKLGWPYSTRRARGLS